jgi:drug/metabolite transporter (DMT)-like permease
MSRRPSQATAGVLLAITAGLAFGGMFPVAKTALDHMDALHLTAVRYVVGSLVFLAVLAAVEGRAALRYDGRFGRLLALGTIGFAGFNLLSYIGLEHAPPQNAALVVATMPFVALIVVRLRDGVPIPRARLVLVAVGFAGLVMVITRGDVGGLFDGGFGGGEALILVGVVAWVFYTLAVREFSDWSALRFTALSAAAGTLPILAITEAATLAGWASTPSASDLGDAWWQLLYIIFAGANLAILSWNTAVRLLGPPNVIVFNNLVPVTTFSIALIGGYAANAWELGGAAVTIAALVAVTLLGRAAARAPSRTRSAAPPAPVPAPARRGA